MVAIVVACVVSLVVALLGTPLLIHFLVKKNFGQFIRQDGPTAHYTKRGTPTMGGVVIIFATLCGWIAAHIYGQHLPDISSLLLILLFVGLGVIGFIDDYIKISRQRSLGLNPMAKILGQLCVGSVVGLLALSFPNTNGVTPASMLISTVRDTKVSLAVVGTGVGVFLFLVWVNFLVAAWSNAVNLTDGLDGLATGASMTVFGAYTIICIWEFYQSCSSSRAFTLACYESRDPRGLAIVSIAIVGACFGFLWWNTSPARIFMGDTGSLALGGAIAGLSIMSHTELLAVVLGGLFVIVVLSDVIQISCFKLTGKRVFRMAPLHHHFELKGWQEITIVVRFWIISGLCSVAGLALFYAEWVARAR